MWQVSFFDCFVGLDILTQGACSAVKVTGFLDKRQLFTFAIFYQDGKSTYKAVKTIFANDKLCDFASANLRGPKLIACGLSRFVPDPKDSRESQKAFGVRGFSCAQSLGTLEFVESNEIYAIGMTVLQNHGCNRVRSLSRCG